MNLTIPLLVSETRPPGTSTPMFGVTPLLERGPSGQSQHLSRAVTKLANELRKHLDQLGRQPRHDQLLRWTFCPAISEHQLKERLILRRGTAEVRVLVVSFAAFDRRIALIPVLPGRWFEIVRGQNVLERARDVLTEHLNELQKESEDFELPEQFTSKQRNWVTTLELDVRIEPEMTSPEKSLFALLGGDEKMSGRQELHAVGRCLDWLYPEELDRTVLRESEVSELQRLLSEPDRRPVLLLGPSRVGKTAVIHECVFQRVKIARQPHVAEQNVWLLSPQRLISGMSYVGQWENRVVAIFGEAAKRDHVLYFDDILGLYYAGQSRDSDLTVAHVIKPYVERRDFRVLAEMTPEVFRVLQERDRGMADLFHIIPIRPTSTADTRRISIGVLRQLEGRYKTSFNLEVLPVVWELNDRYQRELAQPGKSALLLRQLAGKYAGRSVTRGHVLHEYHESSGLPLNVIDRTARMPREEVLKALRAEVAGQALAVEAMADAVCMAKAGLNDPNRPLASFLFLGPTGVGKTHCAKALARYLFGGESRLLRFDMNEFVDGYSVARLVGTARDPEGLLTSAIRRQPFSIVLLDEIEKAHPAAFDLLLQVLGEGRLTDALGRTADFSSAIVIMTSNLGAREAGMSFGLRPSDRSDSAVYVGAAEKFFRPEFFNRIDRIVPFEKLDREQIGQIANRLIHEVFQRDGLVHRRCILGVDPRAMEQIVEQGYHPQLGARALKRCIERELTQPVAARLSELRPDAATMIHLYPSQHGIAAQLQPLINADRRPIVPPSLDLSDWEDVLDRVEDAVARIEEEATAFKPDGSLVQGELSGDHFRYLAVTEYSQHLRRFIERIDHDARRSAPRRIASAPRSRMLRVPKKSLRLFEPNSHAWRDLGAAQDLKAFMTAAEDDQQSFGESLSDKLTELIGEASLLDAMSRDYDADKYARCLIWLRSVVSAVSQLQLLASLYTSLFPSSYGFAARAVPTQRAGFEEALLLEMPGIYPVMATEQGTHLFSQARGNVIPVQVIVAPLGTLDAGAALERQRAIDHQWRADLAAGRVAPESDPFPLGPVLRLYDPLNVTVDLRSGLVATRMLDSAELRKFILAQLQPPRELVG
jgi:ATP-dependent Clp protease ATP-binding subunit ClpA